ncbi:ComEC/Rec2 family competence protein [Luteimicrobium sp. DT211]|uniref:ComEC/Rec2 family competence protein n=1 Tax=Luteimicrobium sp. DT211 TaxID=3393412 RepID=UPI003CF1CFD5
MTAPARPPVDLRLAPAALSAWLAGWWATGADARTVALGAAVVPVLGAAAAMGVPRATRALGRLARLRRARRRSSAEPGSAAGPALGPAVALAAAVVAVVLAACAAQQVVRDRSGLADLAAAGRVVTVAATVRDDPTPLRATWGQDVVLASLEVTAVDDGAHAWRAAAPLLVRGDPGWTALAVGTRVTVTGRLRPADPGEREVAQLVPLRAPEVRGPPRGPVAVADALRADLMGVTDDLSPQARALVPGVAVGDVTRLPDDLDAVMRTVGLTHVTAVSGGHFAIVVATLSGLCAALGLGRWPRLAVLVPATTGFVLLVRPDPSVVRSAAMCAVTLAGAALGRPARAVPALAASVVVLLVADPWLARAFGFVLSVAATAGIVLLAGPVAARLSAWLPRPAALVVAVPLAAQAACGPVLVLLAPAVSLWSVPANLVADPALAPATVLGVLATLLAPLWPAGAHLLAWCAGCATWWIARVATVAAGMPGASLPWMGGLVGALLLALATVAAGVAAWNWRTLARAAGVSVPWAPGARPALAGWWWVVRGTLRACLQRPDRPAAPAAPVPPARASPRRS